MPYKIKVSYETGDSNGREDAEDVLEMEWATLSFAKAALARIKEHWAWYEYTERPRWLSPQKALPEPKWHKGLERPESLVLVLDDGNEVKFWPNWCGYFERLHGAEIVLPPEEGTSFSV